MAEMYIQDAASHVLSGNSTVANIVTFSRVTVISPHGRWKE
jgi:hypothetical protein